MRRAVIAVVLAAGLLWGCGGGDSTGAGQAATAQTSKAEYIKRADAICKVGRAKAARLLSQAHSAGDAGDLSRVADLLDREASFTEGELRKLRAIPRPSGDATVLSRLYASSEGDVRLSQSASSKLREGDVHGFEVLVKRSRAEVATTMRIAQGYGFRVCGQA